MFVKIPNGCRFAVCSDVMSFKRKALPLLVTRRRRRDTDEVCCGRAIFDLKLIHCIFLLKMLKWLISSTSNQPCPQQWDFIINIFFSRPIPERAIRSLSTHRYHVLIPLVLKTMTKNWEQRLYFLMLINACVRLWQCRTYVRLFLFIFLLIGGWYRKPPRQPGPWICRPRARLNQASYAKCRPWNSLAFWNLGTPANLTWRCWSGKAR